MASNPRPLVSILRRFFQCSWWISKKSFASICPKSICTLYVNLMNGTILAMLSSWLPAEVTLCYWDWVSLSFAYWDWVSVSLSLLRLSLIINSIRGSTLPPARATSPGPTLPPVGMWCHAPPERVVLVGDKCNVLGFNINIDCGIRLWSEIMKILSILN